MRVLVVAVLLSCGSALAGEALAQRAVAPTEVVQPTASDLVIRGTEQVKDITCNGNAVYVRGQQNVVQVHGRCRFVHIEGDGNHLRNERGTTADVEGNENAIFVVDPETKYSTRGIGNRVQRTKH